MNAAPRARIAVLAAVVVLITSLFQTTGVRAATKQSALDIGSVANFIMPTGDVPTGTVIWDDTTYRLDARVFHSRNSALGWYPDQLTLSVPSDARSALAVRLLINLDGSSADFSGQKVGEVALIWKNGTEQTVDLIAGSNVRGWLLSDSNGPPRDPNAHEVYRGLDVYGRAAVVDSLTVQADPSMREVGLVQVSVRDTSFDTANSLDPALVVRAVTVIGGSSSSD